MLNGSSRLEGTVIGAQTAHEEFCHAGHRRDGDGYGASDYVYGTTCLPLSLYRQIPNWKIARILTKLAIRIKSLFDLQLIVNY